MHPGEVARHAPDRPAVIMASSGETITYAELDARANRLSRLFRDRGLLPGATVAIVLPNEARFLEVVWAAQRAGLYYTAVGSQLTASEAAYIIDDSGAELVISSFALAGVAAGLDAENLPSVRSRLMIGGECPGWESYERAVEAFPPDPVEDACEGDFVLYSSGTTGRPKGIKRPLTLAPLGKDPLRMAGFLRKLLGMGDGDVYLAPAPLYHAAPLTWAIGAQRLGATVVVMERFDPARCLELIEDHKVTHGQFVPTMFNRMLKLPDEQRRERDVSSLRAVAHAAAPCPVEVKRRMIDWWGPIVNEYYSSTEGIGATWVDSAEWLKRPGTVGKVGLGRVHILDDDGNELPSGEAGTVWFEGGRGFEYHNDPEKTRNATNDRGWATVGDIGYLDDEGYLYLTDRKAFVIISGGVNIYPQEAENILVTHPKVLDAAVIGVPNEDFGEEVKAIVQLIDPAKETPETADELIEACRSRLARYKCPRSVAFVRQLPRSETGKLYKRLLTEQLGMPSV